MKVALTLQKIFVRTACARHSTLEMIFINRGSANLRDGDPEVETILENRGSAFHVPRAICRAERGRKDRVAAIEIPRFGQIASNVRRDCASGLQCFRALGGATRFKRAMVRSSSSTMTCCSSSFTCDGEEPLSSPPC